MIERLPSGQSRLDLILGGGLVRNSICIVAGLPGSGKTLMAQQFAFENATPDAPALYCTTVSEPLDKLIRYGQTLAFFDTEAVGSRIFFEDLGEPLLHGGLAAVEQRLNELIRDRRPALLAIDSFRALQAFAGDQREFRIFISELAGRLSALRATSLWVGEYEPGDIALAPEFAVADTIIGLTRVHEGERVRRDLEVLKSRGSSFLSGRHAYRLSDRGLEPFPRLADVPRRPQPYDTDGERSTFGIAELDQMMGGGLRPATATLIAGPSGVGKTTLGIQSLVAGAASGQPGLIANLQENPAQLHRLMDSVGWDPGSVDIFYRSPVDLYLDQWVYELLDRIEATGAKRVLIDSLTDLQLTTRDPIRFEEYLYSLIQRLAQQDVLLFVTAEVTGSATTKNQGVMHGPISHLADNVLMMRYVSSTGEFLRALSVVKTRASANDGALREVRIARGGVQIGDRLDLPDGTSPSDISLVRKSSS